MLRDPGHISPGRINYKTFNAMQTNIIFTAIQMCIEPILSLYNIIFNRCSVVPATLKRAVDLKNFS